MKYVGSARCDESTLYVVTRIFAPFLTPSDIIIVDAFLLLALPRVVAGILFAKNTVLFRWHAIDAARIYVVGVVVRNV